MCEYGLRADKQVEQDFELASGEYEHCNNLLKTELPAFIQMATRFIDPLFHSFYYMQCVSIGLDPLVRDLKLTPG